MNGAACLWPRRGRKEPTLKFYRSFLPFCFPRVFRYRDKIDRGGDAESSSAFPRPAAATFIVNAVLLLPVDCVPLLVEIPERQHRNERHEGAAVVGR